MKYLIPLSLSVALSFNTFFQYSFCKTVDTESITFVSTHANCKDITVQLDTTGNVHISPNHICNDSIINCEQLNLSIDIADFNCSNLGTNTVTLTTIDNSGNTNTCTATVTIEDNIAPIIDCPAPIYLTADSKCEALVPDFVSGLNVNNNCATVTVTQVPAAGTTITIGLTMVTLTAIDDSGNTASCTTTVTVIDVTPPTFTLPKIPILYSDSNGVATMPDLTILVTDATDNCWTSTSLIIEQYPLVGTTITTEETRAQITVMDSCGNFRSMTFRLEVCDTVPTSANIIESYNSTIYPNPATNKLYVNNLDEFAEYSIINMHGGILQSQKLNPFLNDINIENLPTGMYFVTLLDDGKRFTSKIVKK